MLWNLAAAHTALGNDAAAIEVHRRALRLAPDSSTDRHRVWAATELAEKDPRAALEMVAVVNEGALPAGDQFVLLHVRALIAAGLDPKGAGFGEAQDHLTAAATLVPKWRDSATAVRLRQSVVRKIAKKRGGVSGLWFKLVRGG
jgi:hypothetical protein